jgi:hypothetical protein
MPLLVLLKLSSSVIHISSQVIKPCNPILQQLLLPYFNRTGVCWYQKYFQVERIFKHAWYLAPAGPEHLLPHASEPTEHLSRWADEHWLGIWASASSWLQGSADGLFDATIVVPRPTKQASCLPSLPTKQAVCPACPPSTLFA